MKYVILIMDTPEARALSEAVRSFTLDAVPPVEGAEPREMVGLVAPHPRAV